MILESIHWITFEIKESVVFQIRRILESHGLFAWMLFFYVFRYKRGRFDHLASEKSLIRYFRSRDGSCESLFSRIIETLPSLKLKLKYESINSFSVYFLATLLIVSSIFYWKYLFSNVIMFAMHDIQRFFLNRREEITDTLVTAMNDYSIGLVDCKWIYFLSVSGRTARRKYVFELDEKHCR